MRQLIEESRRLISIPSVTADGNEAIANHAAMLMRARGLKVQLQQVSHSLEGVSKRQFNVVGIFGDPLVDKKTRKGLLLACHLDTVGPGRKDLWTETGGNAFSPAYRDGKIFGLGAADTKLDFLCKLLAIEKFRETKLKMPIYLAGTCGGEMGMFGARYLIKSLALNPKYVLVGEPSENKVVHAHKCQVIFKVSIGYSRVSKDAKGFNRRVSLMALGRSAHGASPEDGVNAILRLLEFVRLAEEAGFDLRITRFWGGEGVNTVPDRASTEFFLTSHQLEDFRRYFSDYCNSSNLRDAFEIEFGGLGEAGVQFLPDQVFRAICDSVGLFGQLSAELAEVQDKGYDPTCSTINFGQMVDRPGSVDLCFDIRLLPHQKPEELEQRVRSAFQQLGAHYPGLNLVAVRERTAAGLDVPMDRELVRICRSAVVEAGVRGPDDGFACRSASTEAAQFFQAGYDALAFGPGQSVGNSHGPNECIDVEQLEKAIRFYEKVIEKACV
jgi:acetylornithine deacetylase/succinyl-diaminopimelate desuccinylase-like protein